MTIDDMYDWLYRLKSELVVYMPKEWHDPMRCSIQDAITFSRKYQMLKADYENRLKADMVAMLTDIQLEIREYHEIGCDEDCNNCRMVGCVEPVNVIKDLDIIQQKIDALKGRSEEV